MTTPIGSNPLSGASAQGASGAAGGARPALDREAFLKLLVAQLSQQDPLAPAEGTEFVAQLATFAQVEQAIAQTQRLDLLSTQMRGLSNNEAVGLVGQTVTVRGRAIAYDGVSATGASVTLDGPAQQVTATIRDASGRAVRTLNLGPRPAGALSVAWDGMDDSGQRAAAGSYSVDVRATQADGTAVGVTQDVTGVVARVTFDRGYAELVLDSGARAPIADLVSVAQTPRRP